MPLASVCVLLRGKGRVLDGAPRTHSRLVGGRVERLLRLAELNLEAL